MRNAPRFTSRRPSLALAAVAALVGGCGASDASPEPAGASADAGGTAGRYHVEGGTIRDELGHSLLLRGVNARIEGVFDSTFEGDRPATVRPIAFGDDDAATMAAWGFNLLRLAINWSGVEPTRGQYDEAYLARVRAVIDLCARHGVYVVVDFHQDGYSKWIGQDGAPLWAVLPPPDPTKQSYDSHTSIESITAFFSHFWPNDEGLQDAYAAAVAHTAAALAGAENMVGVELMNEPVALDWSALLPLHHRVTAAARGALAGKKLWFFEPPGTRNQLDEAPLAPEPFPEADAVYSPHIYTNTFSTKPGTTVETSFAAADAEAASWNAALFVGEWGGNPDDVGSPEFFQRHVDQQNAHLASSALWVWKEDGPWGMFSGAGEPTVWTPRPAAQRSMTGPFPAEVDGRLTALTFDRATATAVAEVALAGAGKVLWTVPLAWYPNGAVARCGDAEVAGDASLPGRLAVVCPLATARVELRAK